MTANNLITIEALAEQMGKTVWYKGDLKRIYLNDAGWNTKKMSTKTFIFQDENGDFKVSCQVECPSQPRQWCKSQEDEVKEGVYSNIEAAISELEEISENTEVTADIQENESAQASITTFIGTGKEINDCGLFPHIQPTDGQIFLWIKWHWSISDKKENFAPVVELFVEKQENSTHKLGLSPTYYFHLDSKPDGTTPFESFIAKFIAIVPTTDAETAIEENWYDYDDYIIEAEKELKQLEKDLSVQ